ncbi:hypothetical protein RJ527_03465 [Thalassospiraceae bacterium LMO-SO8]|nr:hypothetical protein [Alphaproteobacteria bacterium LMO-S08]WND76809.1 hypothetical protein RJ527_03465 [Thalassospiraceae bacterium LMO-SO8]
MFTLSRTHVVPALVLGLTLMTAQSVVAASPYDTMSSEEIADHQSQQLGQQEGQIVQPKAVDNTQLASAAATQSAEEFAAFEGTLNVVTIVTPTAPGSDD